MVTKVNEKDISAKTKGGEVSSIPYGMIVWSTSIGTRPVIKDFMKHINQDPGFPGLALLTRNAIF
ncbi:hypothetical protein HID58_052974 [Brassica napus]|uniref:Uncharacterized protein n=2 Tax=Brassica TaxID=3705 RepID=A0ABQ8AER0_BRANA|nr:hypothetical protein HID58_052974 [Brassica napus]VDC91687.1 unnamed protein product [Brassica oleracea]